MLMGLELVHMNKQSDSHLVIEQHLRNLAHLLAARSLLGLGCSPYTQGGYPMRGARCGVSPLLHNVDEVEGPVGRVHVEVHHIHLTGICFWGMQCNTNLSGRSPDAAPWLARRLGFTRITSNFD